MADAQSLKISNRPLIALVAILVVIAAMVYGLFLTQRMSTVETHLTDAAIEISTEITEAQLLSHKAVINQNPREIDQVWIHLETANRYTQAILKGGRVKGLEVPPCQDVSSSCLADSLREDLTSLAREAKNWLAISEVAPRIIPPPPTFATTFDLARNKSHQLKANIHESVTAEIFLTQLIQVGLIMLCMICVGWVLVWIRNIERLRQLDIEALALTTERLTKEVSSRNKAETTLRAKEHLLATTLDSTADGILVVNSEGRTVLANAQFARIWNIPDQLMVDRDDEKMLNFVLEQLEDPQIFLSKVRLLYNSSENDMDTLIFKNGRIVERFSCPLIEGDDILGRVWSFRDITEREQTEKALQESEANYQNTLRNLPSGVIILAANTSVILTNKAACNLLGVSSSDLRGQCFDKAPWPFVRSDGSEMPVEEYPSNRVLATNQPVEQFIMGVDRPDGTDRIWMAANAFPLFDKNKKLTRIVVSLTDVTNLKKTEIALGHRSGSPVSIKESEKIEELAVRAIRLETAGQIAGQVAHDFNNLLGPLMAYPDLIRCELPQDHPALKLIELIEDSAKQMTEINQELLTLGRRGQLKMSPQNLNEIITDTLAQLELNHDGLDLQTELPDSLPCVNGSRSQIIRVINNLIINASDACNDEGRILVQASHCQLTQEIGKNDRIPPGEYVKVSISDNGAGIPEAKVGNIFDPFFSTKKADRKRGSGLGLSVVHAVMKDHRGYIDLESKLNEGTTFYLYFPLSHQADPTAGSDDTTLSFSCS